MRERDRTGFLLELSRRGLLPEEWRSALTQSGFDERRAAAYLHETVRQNPASILDELHAKFTRENAIRLAFDWSQDAKDWRSALLGRVFIFSLRHPSLTEAECLALLAQMREVVSSLPPSALRDRYLEVLDGVEQIGQPKVIPRIIAIKGDSFLDRALQLAAKIVMLVQEKGSSLSARDLRRLLEEGNGFVYDQSAKLNDHGITLQMGNTVGTFWFPPLAQIALTLASTRLGLGNYAEQFVSVWLAREERLAESSVGNVLSQTFSQYPPTMRRSMLHGALVQVRLAIAESGLTAKLDDLRRHLLLLSKQFAKVKGGLRTKAPLPTFGETEAWIGDYDRACAAARSGMVRRSRSILERTGAERPQLLEQAWNDPDFRALRRLYWFRKLLGR